MKLGRMVSRVWLAAFAAAAVRRLFAVRYQTRGHRRLAAEEGVTAAG
jgi:hypothetical protein